MQEEENKFWIQQFIQYQHNKMPVRMSNFVHEDEADLQLQPPSNQTLNIG